MNKKRLYCMTVLWMIGWALFADEAAVYGSIAVSGYDPVAYFTMDKPVKGREEFQLEYNGATWQFSSREHLDLFRENPERYAPQYGGYCAWAVSNDYTAPGNPDDWTIHEGKLYLNFNGSVRRRWQRNMEEHIVQADRNWPDVLNK